MVATAILFYTHLALGTLGQKDNIKVSRDDRKVTSSMYAYRIYSDMQSYHRYLKKNKFSFLNPYHGLHVFQKAMSPKYCIVTLITFL